MSSAHPAYRRFDTFEFSDVASYPAPFRRAFTQYLEWVMRRFGVSSLMSTMVSRRLRELGDHRVVDLCAGSGGPWRGVLTALEANEHAGRLEIRCTDAHPTSAEGARTRAGTLVFERRAMSATTAARRFDGLLTMINGIHHLGATELEELARHVYRARRSLLIVETNCFRLVDTVKALAAFPLFYLFSLERFAEASGWHKLFTFVVPLIPLCATWDAVSSHLRSYRPEQIAALFVDSRVDTGFHMCGPLRVSWAYVSPAEHRHEDARRGPTIAHEAP